MSLYTYFSRLYSTVVSRQEISIDQFDIQTVSDGVALFVATLRFYDGSILFIEEMLDEKARKSVEKLRYRYHYQNSAGNLIFRYDNAPHHPSLKTYPHHKHEKNKISEANPLDLGQILREIDAILYPSQT